MKGKRNTIFLSLAVIIVVAIGFGAIWFIDDGSAKPGTFPQTARLRDGTTLTITGVTFGTNHLVPQTQKQRLLARLPGFIRTRFNIDTDQETYGTRSFNERPMLCVWYTLDRASPATPGSVPIEDSLDLSILDGSGAPSVAGAMTFMSSATAQCFGFKTFPRRERKIKLLVQQEDSAHKDKYQPVATFEFGNPADHRYPEWRPGPRVAANNTGTLKAELKSLRVGPAYLIEKARAPYSLPEQDYELALEFSQNEVPSTDWRVESVEISDATGNVMESNPGQPRVEGRTLWMWGGSTLFPDGSAWKLRFRVSRLPSTSQLPPSSELFIFKNVPIPAVGQGNAPALTSRIFDNIVSLDAVVSRNGSVSSPKLNFTEGGGLAANEMYIMTRREPAMADGSLILTELSAGGRVLTNNVKNPGSPISGSFWFRVTKPTNASTCDLTMALQKCEFIEFMAAPEVVKGKD
jgi:hypothetical protein